MAVNPLLSLQVQAPDVGQAFSNALLNVQRLGQIQDAAAARPSPQALFNVREQERIKSLGIAGQQIIPDLQRGNVENVVKSLTLRRSQLEEQGLPTDETDEAIQLAQTNPGELLTRSQQAVELAKGLGTQRTGQASAKTEILKSGAIIQSLPTGETEVRDPEGNVVTGQERLDVIREAREQGLELKREQAQISVKAEAQKERAKLKERRISEITTEISTRNRDAARSERTVNKALTLAQQASQGLSGATKLRLSRLMPGIDAGDEAALDAATKELALEQLQAFKGPTTDFEFGVTQSIAGGIGQSKQANIARLKSLKRATWFNQREEEQFRKHTKTGGDPDSFRFNFGEPIRTKKGVFTLQDLQDTAVQQAMTIDEVIKSLNK
jgi:hypothetical protein